MPDQLIVDQLTVCRTVRRRRSRCAWPACAGACGPYRRSPRGRVCGTGPNRWGASMGANHIYYLTHTRENERFGENQTQIGVNKCTLCTVHQSNDRRVHSLTTHCCTLYTKYVLLPGPRETLRQFLKTNSLSIFGSKLDSNMRFCFYFSA